MDVPEVMTFSNNRQAALLIMLVSGGILLACAWSLLRPWPPGLIASLFFGGIALICVTAFGYALIDRELRLDFAGGEVHLRHSVLGLDRHQRWRLHDFQRVVVAHRTTERSSGFVENQHRPQQSRERQDYYMVELHRGERRLTLDRHDSLMAAEEQALHIARLGRWQAWRSGYAVRRLERVTEAPPLPKSLNLVGAMALARSAAQATPEPRQPGEQGRVISLSMRRTAAGGLAEQVSARITLHPSLEGRMDEQLLPRSP